MAQDEGGAWVAKTDPLLARIAEVAESGSARSDLAVWMSQNHGALLKQLGGKRQNWERLTREFVEAGLMKTDIAAWAPEKRDDPTAKEIRKRAAATAKRTWGRTMQRKGKAVASAPEAERLPLPQVSAPKAAPPQGQDPEALLARLGQTTNRRSGRRGDGEGEG